MTGAEGEEQASKPRTAYIRTFHNPKAHADNINWLSQTFVHQALNSPRHRFILGAATPVDETALTALLHASRPLSEWDPDHAAAHIQYGSSRPLLQRSDLEVWISASRARSGDGTRLKTRMAEAGVEVRVAGEDDEQCDAEMLDAADYVIDDMALGYAGGQRRYDWFRAVREGRSEVLEGKFDYSQVRLRARYGQHSWTQGSGNRRARGTTWYACTECGGRCKARGTCKVTGKEIPPRSGRWVETGLPEDGDEKWRGLTAEEVIHRFVVDRIRGESEDVWHSVDTFAGE